MAKTPSKKGPKLIGETKRKRFNVNLDPSLKDEAEAAAKADGLSFSMWLEIAAREQLNRRKNQGGSE